MRLIFPFLLAFLTGHKRQIVKVGRDFEWSSKSWVHNIFRIYEIVFGRRWGIRCESSMINGVQFAHTWEASCALIETKIRDLLSFKFTPSRIYIPLLQTPQGLVLPASPYLFAIAFDNALNDTENTTGGTWTSPSFTVTGSNLLLIVEGKGQKIGSDPWPAASGVAYNSVASGGRISSATNVFGTTYLGYYYLIAPTTGAHTATVNFTATIQNSFTMLVSYSGVSQTGFPDSSNEAHGSGASTITASTTVVASNCWLNAITDNDQNVQTVTTGTMRANGTGNVAIAVDSNGVVGTGSRSVATSWTGAGNWAYVITSFAPAGAGGGGGASPSIISDYIINN